MCTDSSHYICVAVGMCRGMCLFLKIIPPWLYRNTFFKQFVKVILQSSIRVNYSAINRPEATRMGQKGSKESPGLRQTDRNGSKSKRPNATPSDSRNVAPMTLAEPTASQQPPPLRHTMNEHVPTSTNSPDRRTSTSSDVLPHRQTPSSAASRADSLDKFFTKYKDEREDAILAAGMEQFCEDLEVSPTDLIVLIIAWKFQASEMCRFTREEFINGCQRLKVTDAKTLKQRFPDLVLEIQQSDKSFKDLYNFTFSFGLDHASGQRALPVDMAMALWELVFTFNTPPILGRWLAFVGSHAPHGISRDTWNMFLPFVTTIKPDLSNYDESEAWPSLFDDFVEMEQQSS